MKHFNSPGMNLLAFGFGRHAVGGAPCWRVPSPRRAAGWSSPGMQHTAGTAADTVQLLAAVRDPAVGPGHRGALLPVGALLCSPGLG